MSQLDILSDIFGQVLSAGKSSGLLGHRLPGVKILPNDYRGGRQQYNGENTSSHHAPAPFNTALPFIPIDEGKGPAVRVKRKKDSNLVKLSPSPAAAFTSCETVDIYFKQFNKNQFIFYPGGSTMISGNKYLSILRRCRVW